MSDFTDEEKLQILSDFAAVDAVSDSIVAEISSCSADEMAAYDDMEAAEIRMNDAKSRREEAQSRNDANGVEWFRLRNLIDSF